MRLVRKKQLLDLALLVVLLAIIGLLVPDCRKVVLGWLNNEPFYQGKPARSWRERLIQEKAAGEPIRLNQGDVPHALQPFWKEDGSRPVPVLLVLLKDDDAYVRRRAAEALGHLRPQDEDAVAALIERLSDDNEEVRCEATAALGKIGLPTGPVFVALVRASRDRNEVVRLQAVRGLSKLGTGVGDPIPVLIDRLQDDDELVRWETAEVLGRLGPAAQAALPALEGAQKDPSPFVRKEAAASWQRIMKSRPGMDGRKE